jgi:hypothetical protein
MDSHSRERDIDAVAQRDSQNSERAAISIAQLSTAKLSVARNGLRVQRKLMQQDTDSAQVDEEKEADQDAVAQVKKDFEKLADPCSMFSGP